MSKYKQDIIKLRKQDKSYREIENDLGCSRATISYHCRKEDLEDIGLRTVVDEDLQKSIDETYKDNTLDETSEKLGVSEATVLRHTKIEKPNDNGKTAPDSIRKVSKKTRRKILRRLMEHENLGCSRCGWDKAIGDLHHIEGRDIENPDKQENLSYLCPNCHRLVHKGKVEKEKLVSFDDQLGNSWKKYYGYAE